MYCYFSGSILTLLQTILLLAMFLNYKFLLQVSIIFITLCKIVKYIWICAVPNGLISEAMELMIPLCNRSTIHVWLKILYNKHVTKAITCQY